MSVFCRNAQDADAVLDCGVCWSRGVCGWHGGRRSVVPHRGPLAPRHIIRGDRHDDPAPDHTVLSRHLGPHGSAGERIHPPGLGVSVLASAHYLQQSGASPRTLDSLWCGSLGAAVWPRHVEGGVEA